MSGNVTSQELARGLLKIKRVEQNPPRTVHFFPYRQVISFAGDSFARWIFERKVGRAARVAKFAGTGDADFVRVPGGVALRKIARNGFRKGFLPSSNRSVGY